MADRPTALITGATGGIGRALCCEFARKGYRLIITGRHPGRLRFQAEQLRKAFHVEVYPIGSDLGVKGAARELCARLDKRGEQVDILVNNAGFGLAGDYTSNHPDIQRSMLYVNVHSPTDLCRHYLPGMLERGTGKILNVASTAAFVAGPYHAMYGASKSYLLSLSRALSRECQNTGVTVTALCPGPTRTGFAHRAEMESTLLFLRGGMSPAKVAAIGYQGMLEGKRLVIPGLSNKAVYYLSKHCPESWSTFLSGEIQRPR